MAHILNFYENKYRTVSVSEADVMAKNIKRFVHIQAILSLFAVAALRQCILIYRKYPVTDAEDQSVELQMLGG